MTSTAAASPEPGAPDADAAAVGLSIAEVSRRCGLSKDTLRYYEKAGLLASVGRTSGGQRRYEAGDLDWLAFLLRLRATGMSISDMQRFAELRRAGDSAVADRLDLLTDHRSKVARHIADLSGHLQALELKIAHYQGLRAEPGRNGTDHR